MLEKYWNRFTANNILPKYETYISVEKQKIQVLKIFRSFDQNLNIIYKNMNSLMSTS